MKTITLAALVLAVTLASCTSVNKNVDNVCPEDAALKCLSEIKCDWDEKRKCNVCFCHNPPNDPGSPHDYDTGGYDDVTGTP
jgi:hypothetical protein